MHSTMCKYNTMCLVVACYPPLEFSTLLYHIHFQLETVGLSCCYVRTAIGLSVTHSLAAITELRPCVIL